MPKTAVTIAQAFEKTLKSFEFTLPIEWDNRQGIVRLDEDRRAVITLDTHALADVYDVLVVEIVHKHNGPIQQKLFPINDYLPLKARVDSRPDYQPSRFFIWEEGEWYIAIPASTRPLCEAVEKYIEIWR